MNRITILAAILGLALTASMLLTPLAAAFPVINRPYDMVEATIEGAGPQTVDYSYAYDTASGEIVFNTMDTLLMFNGEQTGAPYLPSVATSWTAAPLGPGGAGIDSSIPVAGLNFESAAQTGPNAIYFYRYDFKIHGADPATGVTPILFQPYPAGYVGPAYSRNMTLTDIVYSFQRTMVQDRYSGPQWMLQEPLLDQAAGDSKVLGGLADLTNEIQVNEVGRLIANSVQCNNTDVWFNLMFPGAYAPFYQILCQPWSSIESKAWIKDYVIGQLGRNDWSGDWSRINAGWTLDHTGWIDQHLNGRTALSPLDTPYPVGYGSGPFILTAGTPNYVSNYFALTRFVDYFRGWYDNALTGYGGDFPRMAGASPAGYVDTVEVTWNYVWGTRKTMFLSGDCDFCAIPDPSYYPQLYQGGDPSGTPLVGIRVFRPLAELEADACFFTFSISPSTISGAIGTTDTFNRNNIPPDFFGNPTWGIYVRKAFAQAFDYGTYIATVFLGEALQPATAILPGIPYWQNILPWTYNIAGANASFNLAGPDVNGKMLKNVGFTITIAYNNGNTARQKAAQLFQTAIQSLNPLYTVNIIGVDWLPYLTAAETQHLPCFITGWQVDFTDAHDCAFTFYDSAGSFCSWTGYSNPAMDALVNLGVATPNGPARQVIYTQIQNLAISDCPSFMLDQPFGRHFERDWVVGWYYNPLYLGSCYYHSSMPTGNYFYNLWKWYYVPLSSLPASASPFSNYLPFDVNYDGVIDMQDIGTAAASFLATYVNAPTAVPPWIFRADVSNDRQIEMIDIGLIAAHFLETGPTWHP